MSVMMGLRVVADPARVQEALSSDPERLQSIAQRARDAGCIHHRFFANEAGGEVLIVDERMAGRRVLPGLLSEQPRHR